MRKGGDDVFDHAVDEVFLFFVAANVFEGQYRDSRPVGQAREAAGKDGSAGGWQGRDRCGGFPVRRLPFHAEGLNGPFDVLEREAAEVVERGLEPARHRFVDRPRNHDAARRRFALQPRRNVHAVAVEIVAIDDQVAEVQADAEHKGGVRRLVAVGVGHGLLELDRGAQGIHGASELDQRAVAGQLDQPAAITRQRRLEALLAVFPQASSVPLSSRPISRE